MKNEICKTDDGANWHSVDTRYRRIKTPIPVPESLPILQQIERYESRSMHGQLPVVWDRASGFQVYDKWGNIWLDFTSTIFVSNAGHGNPKIIDAIIDVLGKPLLHTYNYAHEYRGAYLKALIESTPSQFEKAFLLSSGTEAVECGIKLMRLYGLKHKKRHPGIISLEGNWHGRTMGAQMLCSNNDQKKWIGYQDPNILHLPFPYPWNPEAANSKSFFERTMNDLLESKELDPKRDICGIMLETFQGWGAVFYPEDYIRALATFAKEHDILLAFDEMQAGFGRTGKLFGYMHYEVEPDLLCCGKGCSSSVPLSIVLASADIMDLPPPGSMSSTHSANPMACAAGLANLNALFDDDLIQNSERLGSLFHDRLRSLKSDYPDVISDVQGRGLLAALIFTDPDRAPLTELCDRICYDALRSGLLLVHTGRESIKMAPPLCITEEALLEGLSVLRQCVETAVADEIGK